MIKIHITKNLYDQSPSWIISKEWQNVVWLKSSTFESISQQPYIILAIMLKINNLYDSSASVNSYNIL
mgnify:CR=1 FL=1